MAKIIALLTVAYAVSPLDLIPDWIPILGYLDDLLIIPIGIGLVLWLTPRHVYDRHARGSADWVPDPKLKKVGRLIVLTGWALGGMIILNTLLPKY